MPTAPDLTALDYLYRDAANFKSFGTLLLAGCFTPAEHAEILAKRDSGTWFIPEQLGLPPLQAGLYAFSNGPTDDDHALHELIALRAANLDEAAVLPTMMTTADFLTRLRAIPFWNPLAAANFGI